MAAAKGSIASRFLRLVDDWWLAFAGVAFIVGSDFKYRTRPPGQALGGGIDSAILIELALYAVVAGYLVLDRFRVPKLRRVPVPLFLAACLVGLAVLSIGYTPYPQYAVVRCLQATILLGAVVVGCMDGGRAQFHRFAHLYLLLIAAGVLYGLARPSPPINAIQEGRFTWLAVHPTVSGAMTGLAAVVAVGYVAGGRKDRPGPRWSAPTYWVLLAIVAGGALAAQTRGAILGAVCGAGVVILSSRRGRALIEIALVGLVLLAGVAILASQQITTYFERGEDAAQLTSLNNRTELWDVAFEAVKEQPMFGNGITASRGIFYAETGLGGGHNAIVNVLVELGIVGLVVWAAMVLSLILGVRRLPKTGPRNLALDRALLLGVITFILVDSIFYEGAGSLANFASTWLFMSIGWYVVALRSARSAVAGPTTEAVGSDRPAAVPA
ncbi:O-antigen ligase family protein [Dermatobacter hominis]|uniref:O-antigen ligase family protein n=1 Tax=Dermatobacter hominis TaxID=2884263 RepID=UPI001D10FFB4|nr:O-antigen ligase family protein [Dermatobacter hominis]UDY35506.1 O-antigen ligase family protein [Dermatobacter hominis]